MKQLDPNALYVVEPRVLEVYKEVMERLYNDNTPWALGERRDLANRMDAVITSCEPVIYERQEDH